MKRDPTHTLRFALAAALLLFAGCEAGREWSTESQEAIRLVQEGTASWQKFYYADALVSLQKAVVADSLFAVAWGRLALTYDYTSNHDEALRALERAEKLSANATDKERRFIRLWGYRIRGVRSAEAKLADSLLLQYPENSELYIFRGLLYEIDRNYEAAVQTYEEGVKRDTGFALGVMSLGYAYSILGDQDKAVAYMQRYIHMAPQEADPRASYADILVRAGRYTEALEQYRKSLELKPDYWYAVREIGTVYTIQGRLRDAEAQFEKAVLLLPRNVRLEATLLRQRAYLDNQRGAYSDAVSQLRAALAIDSSYIGSAYGLVFALGKMKRFGEAWETIDSLNAELVRRNMRESHLVQGYYLLRARLLTEEEKLDEAEAECRNALEASTPFTRGAVYVNLARIAVARHEWEGGLDAVDGALAVNPNSPEALMMLVRIYNGRGDLAMTREIGDRLLTLWRDADADFRALKELRALLHLSQPT